MSWKLGACSLTKMMTGESDRAEASWIDLPEPLASLISEYQTDLQFLQLAILASEPDNLKEIGHCFEKLEKQIEKLQNYAKGFRFIFKVLNLKNILWLFKGLFVYKK